MPVEVILPKVDMDMTHGTLATWHVAPGDNVAKGQALFDIETDKAAMEVEAPASGRLHGVTAGPGDKVAVGSVVALIYAEGEAIGDALPAPANQPTAKPDPGPSPEAVEVILPKVDMDMSHGTIAVWHVGEGDSVTKGAALFDIETDKAAMEVESPATGVLQHIMARPGEKVAVGAVVAFIYPPGVTPGQRPSAAHAPVLAGPVPAPAPATKAAPVPAAPPPGTPDDDIRATPAARAEARRSGLDLGQIAGTGPRGRIQRGDVITGSDLQTEPAVPTAALRSWTAQPGQLHVSTRAGNGTPVLFLHGFTADSQSWAPLEKALGPDLALIRIDLPGHGRSPRRKVKAFSDLARMMVEAFDAGTRDHDRVHLVGHSLGGALALSLADIRPRKVVSLSLIAPAGLGPEIDAQSLLGITRATRAESLAPWLRRLTATPEGISDDYARAAMRLRTDPELRACQADLAEILFPDGVQPFDLRPALSRLDCPTALLWGRQDHILPWRQAISVTGDFALHLLADAGHVPQIECPDRVARILKLHLAAAGGN